MELGAAGLASSCGALFSMLIILTITWNLVLNYTRTEYRESSAGCAYVNILCSDVCDYYPPFNPT